MGKINNAKLEGFISYIVQGLDKLKAEKKPLRFTLEDLEGMIPKKSILLPELYKQDPWLAAKICVTVGGSTTWNYILKSQPKMHEAILANMKPIMAPCAACGSEVLFDGSYYSCRNRKCVVFKTKFRTKFVEEWNKIMSHEEDNTETTTMEDAVTDPVVDAGVNKVITDPDDYVEWNDEDLETLEFLFKAGKKISDLAEIFSERMELEVSDEEVAKQLLELGLITQEEIDNAISEQEVVVEPPTKPAETKSDVKPNPKPAKETENTLKKYTVYAKRDNNWDMLSVSYDHYPSDDEVVKTVAAFGEWQQIKFYPDDGSAQSRLILPDIKPEIKPELAVNKTPSGVAPKSVSSADISFEDTNVDDPFLGISDDDLDQ